MTKNKSDVYFLRYMNNGEYCLLFKDKKQK